MLPGAIPDPLRHAYAQAFHDPNPELQRLYELAKRDQWKIDDLAWRDFAVDAVPQALRQAMVNLHVQTHFGELGALMCTARAAEIAPDLTAKMFGSTQVMDEARHVEFFSRLISQLDCRAAVLPSVESLIGEVYETGSVEELLVGMQVIVEGVAQTLFVEGGQLIKQMDFSDPALASLRGLNMLFGDWLVNYVGRDESRHVAFGVVYVRQRLEELSAARRSELERRANRWGGLIVQSLEQRRGDFELLGLDAGHLIARCASDQQDRLRKCGFDVG
jgi:hypothetical protein